MNQQDEQLKKYDAYIKDTPDGNKEITLSDGSVITMREPTVGDQLIATKAGNAAESEILYIANLTMKTPEDIKKVKMKDYSKLQAALKGFL